MSDALPHVTLTGNRLPLGVVVSAVVAILLGGAHFSYSVGVQVAEVSFRLDAVSAALEAAKQSGTRERVLLQERTDGEIKRLAADVIALQLAQQQTTAFIATATERLTGLSNKLDEMNQTLRRAQRASVPVVERRAAVAVAARDDGEVKYARAAR